MIKDSEHPFFRPLWRRVAVVAACLVWAVVEFATGTPFWGMIALGFGIYGYWQFFYAYKPAEDKNPSDPGTPKG